MLRSIKPRLRTRLKAASVTKQRGRLHSSTWAIGAPLGLLVALVLLPLLTVLASWLQWDAASAQVLSQLWQTVLPQYALTSLWLCLGVGVGVVALGLVTAVLVAVFEFPGRRWLEWALLLPLAMPAYVLAYAYTDFLQFSGPAQVWLRSQFGLQGRVLPEVRSLGGAIALLSLALYPYVYLLARAALAERAAHLMEAARLLGAPLQRQLREVALPLARPAVVAGTALALMETLADFGVVSYFGLQTFSTGIYKAWLSHDNRAAAAQLATVLLVMVLLLVRLEQHARRRLRYASASARAGAAASGPHRLRGAAAWGATAACALPVVLGFVLPIVIMLRPVLAYGFDGLATSGDDAYLTPARFAQWALNSVQLAGGTAVLAVVLAVALAHWGRHLPGAFTRGLNAVAGLGYAMPGIVVVVGLMLPVAWLQQRWPDTGVGYWMTATVLGLVWAYLVRFLAVALNSVQAGYQRLSPSLDEASRMLGVGAAATLWRVHLPLLHRSLAAAALLVFVDVMKELPATLVLRPFNNDTLAVVAYQLAKDERLAEAALPCLALVAVGLVPVVMLSRTLRAKGAGR